MEIFFEVGRFLVMVTICVFIGSLGRDKEMRNLLAWRFTFAAFLLLVFGIMIDLIDDYEYTRQMFDWHETAFATFLEKGVGYLGGFSLIFLAILQWLPHGRALSRAKSAAERALDTKSRFLANMSHELRTPLNAIMGFSQIIRDQSFGPRGQDKYREYGQDIYQAGEHLLALINDILDISKLEAGALIIRNSEIAVEPLLQSCFQMLQVPLHEKNLSARIDAAANITVLGDERRLKQVFINILWNAIKFTGPGGKISANVSLDNEGGIRAVLCDSGVGIAEQDLAKVLDAFVQLGGDSYTSYEGTGLGLPLAAGIMELHDGRLELASRLGVGTEVSLIFPPSRTLAV